MAFSIRPPDVAAQIAFHVATDPYEFERSGGCYLIQSCFGQPCYGCCDVSADTCTFCDESWARSYACDAKADVRKFDCTGGEVLPQASPFTQGVSCLNNCGGAGCDGKTPDSVCEEAKGAVGLLLTSSGFAGNVKDLRTQAMIDAGCCTGDADMDGVPACLDCDDGDAGAGLKVDLDQDGVTDCTGDCDDHDGARTPGALETCDGKDNDCNSVVDDGDFDSDGVLDCADNCKYTPNPAQVDFNGVEGGDACTKPECTGDAGNAQGVADLSCGQGECAKSAGNPIDVMLAEKRETIPTLSIRFYGFDVSVPLTFRSRSDVDVGLGPGWTHPWAMTLSPYASAGGVEKVGVVWKDGTRRFFRSTDAGVTWTPEKANFGSLLKSGGTWVLTGEDGYLYHFDTQGRLSKRESNPGEQYPVVFEFTGDKPSRPSRLRIINNSVFFSYYPAATGAAGKKKGKLWQLYRPGAPTSTWTFDYDADGNLYTLSLPDGKSWQFIYASEDAPYNTSNGGDPHNLTRIMDPDGKLYALFSYDAQDRAVMSTRANGVGKVTTSYAGLGATVTNARTPPGVTTYDLAHDSGTSAETLSVAGPGCGSCGAGTTQATDTDPQGRVTGEVSREGRETNYGNFDSRGDPQALTQAPGTAEERVTAFTYHPTLRRPTSIARPSVVQAGGTAYTIFDYEPPGGPNYKTDAQVLANPNLVPANFNDPARVQNFLFRKIEFAWTRDVSGNPVHSVSLTKYTWLPSYGNVLVSVDGPLAGAGDQISMNYDVYGQIDPLTLPVVGNVQMPLANYNGTFLLPGRIIDPNGVATDIVYDKFGRVTSITVPGFAGKKTEYAYDGLGRVDYVKLPRGNFIDTLWDDAGRLTDITRTATQPPAPPELPAGERVHFTYDDEGNLTKTEVFAPSGALSRRSEFVADALNRLEKALHPVVAGADTKLEYDADNLRTKVQVRDASAQLLRQSRFAHDALSRLTDVHEATQMQPSPQEQITHLDYDPDDNLTGVTDPRSHASTYAHDDLGRVLKAVSPDSGVTRYEYDAAGNVVKRIETNLAEQTSANVETDYTYDAASRLTGVHFPGDASQDLTYTYDNRADGPPLSNGKGRLVKVQDASGTTYFSYDPRGNLSSETRVQDGVTLTLSYTWDENGNLATTTYPSGRVLTYSYDLEDRVSGVSMNYQGENTTLASGLAYDPFGPLTAITGGGVIETRSYDLAGQIDILHLAPTTGPALLDLDYGFDETGNITAIADTLDASKNNTYQYDLLDRLTNAGIGGLGTFTYGYDATGNRTQATEPGGTTTYNVTSTNNQLASLSGAQTASFTYNPHGDALSDGTRSFEYTLTHQLKRALEGPAELGIYKHDGLSRRTSKSVEGRKRFFVYGSQFDPLGEYDATGAALREYAYVGALRVAFADHDRDSDAVRDEADNCSAVGNPAQADQDADTLGDACDSAPSNPDRDGDGLLDGQEDADHDAFKDATETDPNLADTDGDGFSDEEEVSAGSDPLNPNSTPNNIPTLAAWGAAALIGVIVLAGGWVLRRRWPRATRAGALLLLAGGACLIAPDGLRSQGGPAERIIYIHSDHLGAPLLLTDASQQVVWRATAEPFGRTIPSVNLITFNLRFPGQYEDPETGLVYNHLRTYDPRTGRYLQADPVGSNTGESAYAYAAGNPIRIVDPKGDVPVLLLVPVIYGLIEAGLSISDAIATARTLVDPCESELGKAFSVGLFLIGVVSPGGGYSTGLRIADKGIDVARGATARLPNARGFIREFITTEDQTFFRVFSGDRTVGSFLTKTKPRSAAFAREALDLPRDINRADFIQEVLVPAGTRLRRSRVSGGTFGGRGGAEQFELLNTISRKNFGPEVPFE